MGMSDKDKFEPEKRNENPMNYHSPNISSDWRFNGANLANAPINLVPSSNPLAVGSSAPIVDSFHQPICENPISSQNLGFCDINVQDNASTLTALGVRQGSPASLRSSIDRPLDMGWNPPNSMLKGGIFLQNAPGMFPQSLSQFPADSPFIVRAARFSSFSGGNFSDMVSAFRIPESMSLYSKGGGMIQGPQEALAVTRLKSVSGGQSQKNEMNPAEVSRDAALSVEHGATSGSPLKNERKSESIVRSHEEAKQGVGGSGNESDDAEFSGGGSGGQGEPSEMEGAGGEPSAKGHSPKKRKRNGQGTEHDQNKGAQLSSEAAKDNTESQAKGDQNPRSTTNKTAGKRGKHGSQSLDPPKEEYIHVRARRGQATNSHSLAERVRREKISERMKFLQDLVPGCSKVTGKAVMLDEIINYVQSLQRQVEFLSMKLATVNPRLDFNIGLLAKDIIQPRAGPPSTLRLSPDMPMAYPPLHPSQPGLVQAGLAGMGSPFEILRRTITSQLTPMTGGFKEPTLVPNVWEDELHNVVQMSYGTSAPPERVSGTGSYES